MKHYKKLYNIGIDIFNVSKNIIQLFLLFGFFSFILFLFVFPIINYFTGSIYVLVVTIISIITIISIYCSLSRQLESYNPLKWYTWFFGKSVYINEEYYHDNSDKINDWLNNSFPSYTFVIKKYQIPPITVNGNNVKFSRSVIINFSKITYACEFKLIFNM